MIFGPNVCLIVRCQPWTTTPAVHDTVDQAAAQATSKAATTAPTNAKAEAVIQTVSPSFTLVTLVQLVFKSIS